MKIDGFLFIFCIAGFSSVISYIKGVSDGANAVRPEIKVIKNTRLNGRSETHMTIDITATPIQIHCTSK